MPFGKYGLVLPDIIHNIREPPRVESHTFEDVRNMGFAQLRQYSAFPRMAVRHHPEVSITAGQNVATAQSIQNFLGCHGSEPSVSRPAERQNSA